MTTSDRFPLRFSVISFNTWRPFPFDDNVPFENQKWEIRARSVAEFLKTFQADIFCMQELVKSTYKEFPKMMAAYSYLDDEDHLKLGENIFWRSNLFEAADHGHWDVSEGLDGRQKRHSEPVVWARLRAKGSSFTVLVVSTHFSWTGNRVEARTGHAPRYLQARNTYNLVSKHRRPNEAVIVAGDFNCHHHALREITGRFTKNLPTQNGKTESRHESSPTEEFRNRMQMSDCFEDLGLHAEATYPTPTAAFDSADLSTRGAITYDWIVSNERLTARCAQVVKFHRRGVFPSDHYPVMAMFEVLKRPSKL